MWTTSFEFVTFNRSISMVIFIFHDSWYIKLLLWPCKTNEFGPQPPELHQKQPSCQRNVAKSSKPRLANFWSATRRVTVLWSVLVRFWWGTTVNFFVVHSDKTSKWMWVFPNILVGSQTSASSEQSGRISLSSFCHVSTGAKCHGFPGNDGLVWNIHKNSLENSFSSASLWTVLFFRLALGSWRV